MAQYRELMAEVFGTPDDPQAQRQIKGKVYNTLTDIPAEILGDLGEPIYLMRGSPRNPEQEPSLVAYVYPRLHLEAPAPDTWKDPEFAAVMVPVRRELLQNALLPGAAIVMPSTAKEVQPAEPPLDPPAPPPAPSLDFPSAALDPPDDGGLRRFPEHGLLDEFDPDKPQDEDEADPFANFADQPVDYDAWLMQINSAGADDHERGPAKRARLAQA